MKLLETFKQYEYSNCIGPGVYDIHSPRVPGLQEIKERVGDMLGVVSDELLFVNPVSIVGGCLFDDVVDAALKDCGLKTRGWKETEASLINLVEAAKWARQTYP